MTVDEYYDYGGVELFRSSFQKGWNALLALIAERRGNN
jgi:transaldolase